MTINNISGAYGTYSSYRVTSRTTNSSASKVSNSENSLSAVTSTKVSSAMTDEYIEQIKAQAREDAAKGSYMDGCEQRTGYAALRDAQMAKYISPDRAKAVSQVSNALNSVTRAWQSGKNILNLFGLPYTANVYKGPTRTTAEVYDENGEMIAGYHSDNGYWTSVPTTAESQFQTESNHIYREAYRAAKAEIAAAQQTTAPAQSDDASASLDIKA